MMAHRRLTTCVLMVLVAAAHAVAQTPGSLADQVDLIVRVQPSGRLAGSGLIIAVDQDRVRILTARHVLEGNAIIADVEGADGKKTRPCPDMQVDVTFRFAQSQAAKSRRIECSDTLDAAIIDVEKPATFNNSLPGFSPQRSRDDRPDDDVFIAGLAAGSSWTLLPGKILADSEGDWPISGVGIGGGFSGGAVFDRELGFIGMIGRSSNTLVHAIPASALSTWFTEKGIKATQFESTTQFGNPHFTKARVGAREENARNAIRRYRSAFENMEAAVLAKAYPGERTKLPQLFGDAATIRLDLNECSDVDLKETPPSGKWPIRCAFDMEITRKTGPLFRAASCDYKPRIQKRPPCGDGERCKSRRMEFLVAKSTDPNDPYEWQIAGVGMSNVECRLAAFPK